jgi:hypothetical protein
MTLATSSGVPARPSGNKAEQQPIAVHDMHATVLHPLGIDQTKLTYLFNGRNMRLTDVYGELIPQIVA